MKRKSATTPREAARRLGIRLDSVYSLLWAGKLRGFKKDGLWNVETSSVEQRLKDREVRNG